MQRSKLVINEAYAWFSNPRGRGYKGEALKVTVLNPDASKKVNVGDAWSLGTKTVPAVEVRFEEYEQYGRAVAATVETTKAEHILMTWAEHEALTSDRRKVAEANKMALLADREEQSCAKTKIYRLTGLETQTIVELLGRVDPRDILVLVEATYRHGYDDAMNGVELDYSIRRAP